MRSDALTIRRPDPSCSRSSRATACSRGRLPLAGWAQQSRASGLFSGRQNQELTDYTRGMYDARELAMGRLSRAAHRLHAHGVVGVSIDRGEHSRERDAGGTTFRDLIIELHVLGTAIVEVRHDAPPPQQYIALPLDREVP